MSIISLSPNSVLLHLVVVGHFVWSFDACFTSPPPQDATEYDAGRNLKEFAEKAGESLLFGIEDGGVEDFLSNRVFSKIQNVTSEDYKRAYFHGKNENRAVSSLLSFAHAVVE